MNYHFYSPLAYESWDHRSPDVPGIGGSETAVVELAARLALRGHAVNVYAPIPDDCPPMGRGGDHWHPIAAADFTAPGFWILSRCPAAIDRFSDVHPGQNLWMVCQDTIYPPTNPDGLTHERASKLDLLIALCQAQGLEFHRVYPELKERIALSANGFKVDLAERIEALGAITRDPFHLVYTSSPDRGLLHLLRIVKRAKEFEPRLTVSAAYGWDNIEKIKDVQLQRLRRDCDQLMAEVGGTWLGRMSQERVYREFLSAGIWCYPTNFTETSCITSMEAQALGAIPITNPLWALADNVRYGVFIPGNPKDSLVLVRYVAELIELARDHERQESMRAEMMEYARCRFDWENVAEQYEGFAHPHWGGRFDFQIRHGNGRVLNIGSNDDMAGFGARGGVNLDLHAWDEHNQKPNKVDVIADCRDSLPFSPGSFDSVVLGDILEHMSDDDAVKSLRNAKVVLADGGKIVITVPEDYRPVSKQRAGRPGVMYAENINGSHPRPITIDIVREWLSKAGLIELMAVPIHYSFCQGHGVLAC